jgi:hypothetical protein
VTSYGGGESLAQQSGYFVGKIISRSIAGAWPRYYRVAEFISSAKASHGEADGPI